jgi:hypothetical protein
MRVSIALVIEDEYHARNYLTGLIDFSIDDRVSYHIILPKRLYSNTSIHVGEKSRHFVNFGRKYERYFLYLREIDQLRNLQKSSTFRYSMLKKYPTLMSLRKTRKELNARGKRKGKGSLQVGGILFQINIVVKQVIYFIYRRIRKVIVYINSTHILRAVNLYISSFIMKEKELTSVLKEISPDVVVYVSSLYEYTSIPISKFCHDNKIPYLLITDNWDNISSKRTLWENPDFVGVWGQQSRIMACKLNNLDDSQLLHIGSPRMTPLFNMEPLPKNPTQTLKKVLFVGSSLVIDENEIIMKILKEIKLSFQEFQLIYRPYPWRAHAISEEILQNAHFELDPSIQENVLAGKSDNFDPHFFEYAKMLHEADLVIGCLTTMVLEAAMIGKMTIGLVHADESAGLDSPDIGFEMCEHFKGLERFPNLLLCNDINSLPKLILSNLSCEQFNNLDEIRKVSNWFYNYDQHANFMTNLNSNLINIYLRQLQHKSK